MHIDAYPVFTAWLAIHSLHIKYVIYVINHLASNFAWCLAYMVICETIYSYMTFNLLMPEGVFVNCLQT